MCFTSTLRTQPTSNATSCRGSGVGEAMVRLVRILVDPGRNLRVFGVQAAPRAMLKRFKMAIEIVDIPMKHGDFSMKHGDFGHS